VGLRLGARVGPVSASTHVSSRGAKSGVEGFGVLIGMASAVLFVLTVAPVAVVVLGLWILSKRSVLARTYFQRLADISADRLRAAPPADEVPDRQSRLGTLDSG
jgi:urea transporter